MTAALRVAVSIPACNKYLYDLQVVVPGLAVCVCMSLNVCKRTHDTGVIPSVENRSKKKKNNSL